MTKKYFIVTIFILLSIGKVLSQSSSDDDNSLDPCFATGFSYGYFLPGGDLNKRFGNNFELKISPSYYFNKSNISIGINVGYIFGDEVKENTISNLLNNSGYIIDERNTIFGVKSRERGISFSSYLSKIIPLGSNKRTGIRIDLGIGGMYHWIDYSVESSNVPQLKNQYIKGYDRLSGGISLNQFVGYQYLKRGSKISFYAGFEFYQGFTKNLRKYNYDLGEVDDKSRIDLLYGFKAGWILPIYITQKPEEIYY